MLKQPKPSELALATGISVPYASQLLSGSRKNVTPEIALAAFRIYGVRLGLLAQMSDHDIAKLCEQQKDGSCDHPTATTASQPTAQSGKCSDVTAQDVGAAA